MSIYDKASRWFVGLDNSDRASVLGAGGGPLPVWITNSLMAAGIPTVAAELRIGAGYRTAEFMTTILCDFLTHEAPAMDITRQPCRLDSILPAAS
ncbi:MAG: hypothetical protein JWN62_2183 [Acidimicrobiales bacterium]|nr:hypothetical protein [Acidimicrobiales bacterium]